MLRLRLPLRPPAYRPPIAPPPPPPKVPSMPDMTRASDITDEEGSRTERRRVGEDFRDGEKRRRIEVKLAYLSILFLFSFSFEGGLIDDVSFSLLCETAPMEEGKKEGSGLLLLPNPPGYLGRREE